MMEATEEEIDCLVPISNAGTSTSISLEEALHEPPHMHRRSLVYGVVGLIAGSLIGGFMAHTSTSNVSTVVGMEASDGPSFLSDPDTTAPWSRIAWLMSFPNSGTSYTTKLVRHASLHYTATNYGEGNIDKTLNVSIPVLDNSPNGPFWADPDRGATTYGNLTLPNNGYILTKTHCGTRCMDCDPSTYMETQHQFLMDCLTGKHIARGPDGGTLSVKDHYGATLVHKAVHLVRNPFNNVVSRFHLHLNHHAGSYTNDKVGFREFCMQENAARRNAEKKSTLLEQYILDYVGHVPCHADFLRYVRWHNLAFTTTRNLRLPTMVLHYESYENNFIQTLRELLEFLVYDFRGDTTEFIAGKDYTNYYTDEEKADVYVALKELSYLETWKNIEHYFKD